MKTEGFHSIIPDSGAAATDGGSRINDSGWIPHGVYPERLLQAASRRAGMTML